QLVYNIDATGSFTFTVQSSLRDEQYNTLQRLRTGTVSFALHEQGNSSPNLFTLQSFSLMENGQASHSRTLRSNDLAIVSTQTTTGSENYTVLESGSLTSGDFSWSENHNYSLTQREAGARFNEVGQYSSTTNPTEQMTLVGAGNYFTGEYQKTTT